MAATFVMYRILTFGDVYTVEIVFQTSDGKSKMRRLQLFIHLRGGNSLYGNGLVQLGCISFAYPEHSEHILSNEMHQNCVQGQPEQCSEYTMFTGSVIRTKYGLNIEHDLYLTLIVAQVHLVQ
jgi:hypothetical protein